MQTPTLPDMATAAQLTIVETIRVATPNGVVDLFPFHATRGEGKRKYSLSIHAFTLEEVRPMETCHYVFRGERYQGHFFYVSPKHQGKYTVQFETIIADEEFWAGFRDPG